MRIRIWKQAVQSAFIFLCLGGGLNAAETNFLIIKSFGNPDQAALQPTESLVEGSDGRLYGASWGGGKYGVGTIFRSNKDGTAFQVIYHLSGTNGSHASSGLIEGSDGKLYGTTSESHASYGSVFAVGKDGSGFQVLHRFTGGTNDGSYPLTGVIEGSDGMLYGLTRFGGAFNSGCVFRTAKDGSGYGLVASLRGLNAEGLIEGSDGYLYGTTSGAGTANAGTIFRADKNGIDFRIIHSFGGGTNGARPMGRLVVTPDGMLYGTTQVIDGTESGCIYRVRSDGSDYTVLKKFQATTTEGRWPGGLRAGGDGLLYGTLSEAEAVLGPSGWTRTHYGALFRVDTNGQNFVLLHTFGSTNGAFPAYPPMLASDGLLYGTTPAGGEATAYDRGGGVLYRIRPEGADFEVLEFLDPTGGDGTRPGKLIQAADGRLYGMTFEGGRSNTAGIVYQVNTNGTGYSQIFTFSTVAAHTPTDLTEGRDGSLYATTHHGGTGGRGVVLRISRDGSSATVLRTFPGGRDGAYPQSVVHAADGRLYVSVSQEGPLNAIGFVFSMRTDGSDYRVVQSFALPDGNPRKLIEGSDGWFYGIGVSAYGTLFKFHSNGGYTILHRFAATTNDGRVPTTILEGTDGLLYGATAGGGNHGGGTLFKISKHGQNYERLFDLPGGTNRIVAADLIEGADSFLYGIGRSAGSSDRDTIFRVGKRGERYAVIRGLSRSNRQPSLPMSLVEGGDLAMYLATHAGGDMNIGAIVKFFPPPDLEISIIGGVVGLSAVGLPNRQLRIESSPDLTAWMTLGASSTSGRLTVEDTNAPGARFYRAVVE